jgi:hypothetical protein
MFGSIMVLFILPWLDTSKVRSMRYRPLARQCLLLVFVATLGLGYLGGQPAEGTYVIAARVLTIYYFAYFLVLLPVLGLIEKPKDRPASIDASIRGFAKLLWWINFRFYGAATLKPAAQTPAPRPAPHPAPDAAPADLS